MFVRGIQNGGCNQDVLVTLSHLHKQKWYLAVQILQASICNIAIVAKNDSNTVLHTCCHHTSERNNWCCACTWTVVMSKDLQHSGPELCKNDQRALNTLPSHADVPTLVVAWAGFLLHCGERLKKSLRSQSPGREQIIRPLCWLVAASQTKASLQILELETNYVSKHWKECGEL